MAYRIEEIDGIGKAHGQKLHAAGVTNSAELLARCAGPKHRAMLAAAAGIPKALVAEIRQPRRPDAREGHRRGICRPAGGGGRGHRARTRPRKAANLHAAPEATNAARELIRQGPSLKTVEDWIAAARALPRLLSY